MEKTEIKLQFEVIKETEKKFPVIIVAAGSSSRMQGENKQLLSLCGIPVIARTLMTFENSPFISRIILVTRDEDIFTLQMLAEKYSVSKLSAIVCGGKNRTDSVLKGISRLSENENTVLIHDGARPLVSEKVIENVALKAENFSAVACAVKVKDTVKKIAFDGTVICTPDRSSLVSVQRPQSVNVKEYLNAVNLADDTGIFTDDLSVLESQGKKCLVVEGDYKNIKITTKEDIKLAESYLSEESL